MATLFICLLCLFHSQLKALALTTQSENEFSYMRVVSNATDLPLSAEYDYIIIGGGTAGCPLAATLSKNYSVLVLERGAGPLSYPAVLRADQFAATFVPYDDGKSPNQPFTSLDGVLNARGRILGGSSMINNGFFSKANEEFYPKSGIDWEPGLVEEAYRWVEETVAQRSGLLQWQAIVRDALLEARVLPYNGFTLEHVVGTKQSGSIFDALGRRHGAVELLNNGNFRNLRVGIRATVEKILFSPSPRLSAVGVSYRDSHGIAHRATVREGGEVILSAGAIGSPQLLLFSGVGPVSDLTSMRIPIIKPHPHVGNFMADNPRNNIAVVLSSAVNGSYLQTVGITRDYYVESTSSMFPFGPDAPPTSLFGNLASPVGLYFGVLSIKVPGPASYGKLTLVSSGNISVSPNVQFNYFSNPLDLARCVKGMRKIGDILGTKAFSRFKFEKDLKGDEGYMISGPSLPRDYRSDDSSLESFCRNSITTWWHYHGGCNVGKVVDGDFRVTGINALRVVDGSIFNSSPGTNPQATVMMLGRYAGLKILQQRTKRQRSQLN